MSDKSVGRVLLDSAKHVFYVGLSVAGAYTGAYLATRQGCCKENTDQVMRVVRGVTGGILGYAAGQVAANHLSNNLEIHIYMADYKVNPPSDDDFEEEPDENE